MRRSAFIGWLGVLSLLVPLAVADNPPGLRIPVTTYPPYEYTDPSGEAVGLVPALLRELARRLDRPAVFIPSNPRSAQRGLRVGRFDLYVLARTPESEARYRYVPTVLFHYRQVLLARSEPDEPITSLADLTGKKVAVVSHDTAETLLQRHGRVERITVPDYETGLQLVAAGQAAYFLGNHDVCLAMINSGEVLPLKPVLTGLAPVPAAFAMSPHTPPQLRTDVAAAAEAMARDGTLDRLTTTWLGGAFTLPRRQPWLLRYWKPVALVTGLAFFILGLFVLLLRSMVRRRTRDLLATQSSLAASEERYRQVFNTAAEAILLIDSDGFIEACSEKVVSIYGYEPPELIGRHLDVLYPAKERGHFDEDLAALQKEGAREACMEHRRRDGSPVEVEVNERLIRWQTEGMVVSCVSDISARREAEGALKQSELRLQRAQRMEMAAVIAGQIAHDLNNLLSPVLGLPEFVKKELPEGSRAHQDLDLIQASARRMGEISQQLLTLGRRGHYSQRALDLQEVVHDALTGVRKGLPPEVTLRESFCDGPLPVRGGPAQLMRVVSNLLWNAIEAMPEGGTLEVGTGMGPLAAEGLPRYDQVRPGDYAQVMVRDTGVGIPAAEQESIFEPFFTTKQADRSRGHGLGLSVVLGVVEDHHGYLDVQSQVGRGTTFIVYLPQVDALAAEPVTPETVHGTERLLVVDDDPVQVEIFSRMLSSLGYDVHGVRSGEEAVAWVEKRPVDLLLLDMVMDEGCMDGAETYRSILELRPGLPALLVTGYAESSAVALAQRLGAGPVLRKPLEKDALAVAVRSVLDQRERPGSPADPAG